MQSGDLECGCEMQFLDEERRAPNLEPLSKQATGHVIAYPHDPLKQRRRRQA